MTQQTMFTPATEFIPLPADFDRWKGHTKTMFAFMRNGHWHERSVLQTISKSSNLTARISNLRQRGAEIECVRVGSDGGTAYRMTGFNAGVSTTKGGHCASCTCGV